MSGAKRGASRTVSEGDLGVGLGYLDRMGIYPL
jgi:hypothetical protein